MSLDCGVIERSVNLCGVDESWPEFAGTEPETGTWTLLLKQLFLFHQTLGTRAILMYLAPVARQALLNNRFTAASRELTFGSRSAMSLSATMTDTATRVGTIKPPNILVLGADGAEWKVHLERIINTDLYLVYTTTLQELQSPVWVDNCRLLWLAKVDPKAWPDRVKANVRAYIGAGGTVVVRSASLLQEDTLAGKAILIDENDDSEIRQRFERLGVSCDHVVESVSKTEGYLISDKRVDSFFNGKLPEEEFRISNDAPVTDEVTPVRTTRPDKSKFDTEQYFQYLCTREIGRTILYTEHVSTTMTTIKTIDCVHGAVAVASRQFRAVARGRNSWISPRGCAMYTAVLHFGQGDKIAKRMSFLQHLVALSVVRAIRSVYPSLAVAIKWPNDVYFKRNTKIAGILSTCTIKSSSDFYCYLGCGVNVSNRRPLTCINSLAGSNELTVERFIAVQLTEMERLLDLYERNPSKVLELYHAHWLHTGEEVTIEAANSRATIRQVDEDGFLLAEKPNGEMLRLQPDGNSFDLMKGLITVKHPVKS